MFESDLGARQLAWIDALHICENETNKPRIVDTNGKYSYSYLMFQRDTFEGYGERYNLPHDDIFSKEQQELIALYMLNDNLSYHWKNCTRKVTKDLGYPYPVSDTS